MTFLTRRRLVPALLLSLALVATACGGDDGGGGAGTETAAPDADGGGEQLSGDIAVDGSSTVGPLTSAIQEEYAPVQPGVNVAVGVSGTGGGFERFCGVGDTDISNASRPIGDEEADLCADNGIEFTEIRIGTDALTMVVNNENSVECLDDEQITQIWGPDPVATWSEVDEVDFDADLEVFAPATTSGTYDFFNETVLEPQGIEETRQDYSATENDNDIVRGVQGTTGGWGFFGFAFFQENQETVRAVSYDAGDGCVAPTVENAQNDSYALTRPLFIYVKHASLAEKPHVRDFAEFYLDTVNDVITDVGYIAASEETIEEARGDLRAAVEEAG